ncbi:MAG: anti-phage ZorAB system protein ZorA [Marinobacterium sp.]|nr:anti-phage ZorAB system protein ZorA [Marinobacterium sp.]
MEQTFDLLRLWPEFSPVLQGEIATSSGISALFVLILIFVFSAAALSVCWKYIAALRHVRFYQKKLKQFDVNRLQEIKEHKYYGSLWKEFDESLVEDLDTGRAYNTLDADHFFNAQTLSHGLIGSRMQAAVPGFLTAIGVLGTFAGLQMGLSGLELSKDAGVEALQSGIGNMISGASIAFMTSVWGVFSSLVFNFGEKLAEHSIKKKILRLQFRIDELYPRATAESYLLNIKNSSYESQQVLQGLAEKIGDKMQEAMVASSQALSSNLEDSLNRIMKPAIESLVSNANDGSQDLLNNVTERLERSLDAAMKRFTENVGSMGAEQKAMMAKATDDVSTAVSGMSDQMGGFIQSLEQQRQSQQQADEQQREARRTEDDQRQQAFEARLGALGQQHGQTLEALQQQGETRDAAFKQHMQQVSDESGETLNRIKTEISQQIAAQTKADAARQQQIQNSLTAVQEGNNALTERLEETVTTSVEQMQARDEQLTQRLHALTTQQETTFSHLAQRLSKLESSLAPLADANRQAAQKMDNAANGLGLLASKTRDAASLLAKEISQATEAGIQAADRQQAASQQYQQLFTQLDGLRQQLQYTSEQLTQTAEQAGQGFSSMETQMQRFTHEFRAELESVAEQVAELLNDYGQKVNAQVEGRMTDWNSHTRAYTDTMTKAVQSLSHAVDELESRTGAIQ